MPELNAALALNDTDVGFTSTLPKAPLWFFSYGQAACPGLPRRTSARPVRLMSPSSHPRGTAPCTRSFSDRLLPDPPKTMGEAGLARRETQGPEGHTANEVQQVSSSVLAARHLGSPIT